MLRVNGIRERPLVLACLLCVLVTGVVTKELRYGVRLEAMLDGEASFQNKAAQLRRGPLAGIQELKSEVDGLIMQLHHASGSQLARKGVEARAMSVSKDARQRQSESTSTGQQQVRERLRERMRVINSASLKWQDGSSKAFPDRHAFSSKLRGDYFPTGNIRKRIWLYTCRNLTGAYS